MRRWTRGGLAVAAFPVLLAAWFVPRLVGVSPGQDPSRSTHPPLALAAGGTCRAALAKSIAPELVVGAESPVTLTARVDCDSATAPVHIVAVVDNSIETGGSKLGDLRKAVEALVDALDFSVARAGLVSYAVQPEVLAELTADGTAVKQAAGRFFPRRGSNLKAAIRLGADVLVRGRALAVTPEVQQVLLLVVASVADDLPEDIVAEAAAAKARGIEIVTVAAGGGADIAMLQRVASAPTLAYVEGTSSRLPSLLRQVVADLTSVRVLSAQAAERLPDQLVYSFGSGVPAPRLRGQILSWAYAVWPTTGLTLTYGVVCTTVGTFQSHITSTLDVYTDRAGTLQVGWPASDVHCVPPTTPTSTPLPPTARPTSLPPTPVQTSTPTQPPPPIYLPSAMRHGCFRPAIPLDVAMVIDVSSSMLEPAESGRPKLELAIEAAGAFVDALGLPVDRVAVAAFSRQATLVQALSGDLGTVQTQLAATVGLVSFGSRLDLGLAAGQAALVPSTGPERRRVLVVLTDGRADDPDAARSLGLAVANAGITLYTIGLGRDLDEPLLTEIAGDADRFVKSPTGADLTAIYRRLALLESCGRAPESGPFR